MLVSSSLRAGNPLLALVTRRGRTAVSHEEPNKLVDLGHEMLRDGAEPPRRIDRSRRPLVVAGHINFAHLVWNEFPALHTLRHLAGGFEVSIPFDPLGLIESFCVEHDVPYELMARQGHDVWEPRPAVNPGAVLCGVEAMRDARRHISRTPVPQLPAHTPRFYVSVRERGRTMVNQTEFLIALTRGMLRAYPGAMVVLDGFSLPVDFTREAYDDYRHRFDEREAGARRIVGAVRAALPAALAARVLDITGLPLTAALQVISTCHYYVTHSGTMQHKAGWFFPLPGTMHGNLSSSTPAALRWHAAPVDEAAVPRGLPAELLQDLDVTDMPNIVDRNRDYRLMDVNAAVDAVLADVHEAFGTTSRPT